MAQISFTADVIAFAIHTSKAKVTHSMRPLKVIRGPDAARLSANTVSLAYIRADAVHRGLRDEEL